MITSSKRALPLAESRVLSEYRCTDDVKRALSSFSLLEKLGDYHIKQIDSIFPVRLYSNRYTDDVKT